MTGVVCDCYECRHAETKREIESGTRNCDQCGQLIVSAEKAVIGPSGCSAFCDGSCFHMFTED